MTRLQDAIARAETDFQKAVLREWARLNPEPQKIKMGYLGFIDIVPTLCTCSVCHSPSLIIPDDQAPARGFVLCPQCSVPDREARNEVPGL